MAFEPDDLDPAVRGFHAGYELTTWRAEALANHVLDWVLDFALRPEERSYLSPGRARATMKRAIRATFGNGNDRGVPGEVLLHAICRQFFGSSTVVTKVYFKTADNDTYKGFDSVHCVHGPNGELELWLGEAKFYKSASKAIRKVAEDFEEHFATNYLRTEFALITQKVSHEHPHADSLRTLMHENTSLDVLFERIVVPVFITYDSAAVRRHDRDCPEFLDALDAELRRLHAAVVNALGTDLTVSVRIFFLPMDDKAALLAALEGELAPWL